MPHSLTHGLTCRPATGGSGSLDKMDSTVLLCFAVCVLLHRAFIAPPLHSLTHDLCFCVLCPTSGNVFIRSDVDDAFHFGSVTVIVMKLSHNARLDQHV